MISYQTYVCEICGNESRNKKEIESCEASHSKYIEECKRRRNLLDVYRYNSLKENVKHCERLVSERNDKSNRDLLDYARNKLNEFKKRRGFND